MDLVNTPPKNQEEINMTQIFMCNKHQWTLNSSKMYHYISLAGLSAFQAPDLCTFRHQMCHCDTCLVIVRIQGYLELHVSFLAQSCTLGCLELYS